MNAPGPEDVFRAAEHTSGRSGFFFAEEVVGLERALLARLRGLGASGTLVVDLSGVSLASDAARQLLQRALRQVQGDEPTGRALVLARLGRSVYNVEAMLRSEDGVAVERTDDGAARLLGRVDPVAVETYNYLLRQRTTTAGDLRRDLDLNTIAAATNRLTKLAKIGAARRVGQEPVEGGGLQYRYTAVR